MDTLNFIAAIVSIAGAVASVCAYFRVQKSKAAVVQAVQNFRSQFKDRKTITELTTLITQCNSAIGCFKNHELINDRSIGLGINIDKTEATRLLQEFMATFQLHAKLFQNEKTNYAETSLETLQEKQKEYLNSDGSHDAGIAIVQDLRGILTIISQGLEARHLSDNPE